MSAILDRFLRYAKIDTESDPASESSPSTHKQFDLLKVLADECRALGLQDVTLSQQGVMMATLPANTDKPSPVIGFIAHVDTAPDMSGAHVNPQLIEAYDGSDVTLDKENNIVIRTADFPELLEYTGQPILTTDGKTLLGADDKAGVAAIMEAMAWLIAHPEVEHGAIKVAFTPDEEIGRGVNNFDVTAFGAQFAYTIDGGGIGEMEYENFNAAGAKIEIKGRNVHPGTAKNRMINATLIAIELIDMLPPHERPEHTEGYEGFTHLTHVNGTVEECKLGFIIRDHDLQKFTAKKAWLQKCIELLNAKYGAGTLTLTLGDSYFNMREQVLPAFHLVETAKEAMHMAGVEPKIIPVRGGTDGARLSFMGLPCPNIFTGGMAAHGKYEFLPVRSMEKASEVVVNIARLYAGKLV